MLLLSRRLVKLTDTKILITLIEHFSDFKFEISKFQKLAGFPFWVSTFWSQRNFHFIEFPFLIKIRFVKIWANFHFIEFPFYRECTVHRWFSYVYWIRINHRRVLTMFHLPTKRWITFVCWKSIQELLFSDLF